MEVRPDKLSYLVEIDGRLYVRGRKKLKPVFKFKEEGVPDLDLDNGLPQGEGEVGVSVDNSSAAVQVQPSLRCSQPIAEKCKSSSLSSCSCPDTGWQHVPYSYSIPCPALESRAGGRLTWRNWMNGSNSQKFTEITLRKTSSTSPTLECPYSTSSGPVLPPAPLPLESLLSYVDQSLSAACGKPKLVEGDAKIRKISYIRP